MYHNSESIDPERQHTDQDYQLGRNQREFPHRFQGFPYLVTGISLGVYNISLLPETMSRQELFELGLQVYDANRLDCCVVYADNDCCYLNLEQSILLSEIPPTGGTIFANRILLPFDPEPTPDFMARRDWLEEYASPEKTGGYRIYSCEGKGGMRTKDEYADLLKGLNEFGTSRGLVRCLKCGEWRGVCIDTDYEVPNWVVRVLCSCSNDNRCARCGKLFGSRMLNANYYDPNLREINLYPGLMATVHKCSTSLRKD